MVAEKLRPLTRAGANFGMAVAPRLERSFFYFFFSAASAQEGGGGSENPIAALG